MRCRAARRRLSAYADGALALYEMVALKEHLSGCAACRHELGAIRRLNRLLMDRRAPQVAIDWPRFEARLARRLERQQVNLWSVPWYRQGGLLRGALAAAAVALILLTGAVVLNQWLRPETVSPFPPAFAASGGSTIQYEGPGRLQMVTRVVPRDEAGGKMVSDTFTSGCLTPFSRRAPSVQPTRLTWLADANAVWPGDGTTLVTLRYDDPESGAVEHRYTFGSPTASGAGTDGQATP